MRFFRRRDTPATQKSDGPEASATSRLEAELRQVRLELDFVRSRLSCYVGGGIALTYLVDETPIFVNANDFGGPFNLMNGGRYEEENVDVLFSFIKEDTVFLDIGANIGFFSLKMSRRLGPNGRVYGFEPHPLLYDLLCRNVYVNGLRDVVTCFKLALSDKNTHATLQYPVGHLGGGHVGAGDASGHTLVDAELKRLDDVLGADFRCDLVKIDVEGHEINVLDGMKNIVVNSPQIKILFEKLMPNAGTEAALDAYFAELGLSLYGVCQDASLVALGAGALAQWGGYVVAARPETIDGGLSRAQFSIQGGQLLAPTAAVPAPGPLRRIADHAQLARLEIGDTMVVIEHFLTHRIVEHRVNGKIAPPRVILETAEHVVAQDAPVLIGRLPLIGAAVRAAAKGRDFDGLAAAHYVHQPKTAADDARAAENRAYLLGARAGRDVVVLRVAPEHKVAHRAADHVRGVAVLLQRFARCRRAAADAVARDAVLAEGHGFGLRGPEQSPRENLAEKTPDH